MISDVVEARMRCEDLREDFVLDFKREVEEGRG